MSLFSLFRRLSVFTLGVALPFALIGEVFGGIRGIAVAETALGLFLGLAALRAENAILRIYRVRKQTPEGVVRSLERVLAAVGGPKPRVFCFCDPAPQALVVRSPGSGGSILLSEGLLGSLSEAELRLLLTASVRRLRARGIRFQSLCARLAHFTLELAPRSWLELLFGELRWHENLGALGALRFTAVYSAARFFVDLGRPPVGAPFDAPQGLTRLPLVAGEVINPGSSILHFLPPWSERALLTL